MTTCPSCGAPSFKSPTCIVCVTVRRESELVRIEAMVTTNRNALGVCEAAGRALREPEAEGARACADLIRLALIDEERHLEKVLEALGRTKP